MKNLPKIIAILGPTASGKTDLALALAREFHGEIIAADARTIYRGMNIGTAKPKGEKALSRTISIIRPQEEPFIVDGILHWGIDLREPNEDFSVSDFLGYADKKIEEIIARGHLPFLVGGTGLYVQAVVDRLTFADVPPNLALRKELQALPLEALQERAKALDNTVEEELDMQNPRRLIRAIEMMEQTGKKLGELRTVGEARYEALKLGVDVPKEALRARIDSRVDAMIAQGLIEEVRKLREQYGCETKAMSAIGYKEICEFLSGTAHAKEAIQKIKDHTWQYARRQRTWLRGDERVFWIKTIEEARKKMTQFLSSKHFMNDAHT